eukprot:CAMPEP_0119114008 /NCGR_PEP_ID=MMETSP1180-20130426/45897_1 /TAXON_ID=3052 ORGANISM="Chlamydomonas cf sp, Strain CCMP681" /NCGR_SAMPLE_ID=MMETSP1180 /ASSEMBLY_ACC=CAM_ASM_000741 /LENGTH=78 /DNA_ID=CAMNT_0007102353 /DNA_START=521 /DNA_END=757 /DNA_ORIENTATION=+
MATKRHAIRSEGWWFTDCLQDLFVALDTHGAGRSVTGAEEVLPLRMDVQSDLTPALILCCAGVVWFGNCGLSPRCQRE